MSAVLGRFESHHNPFSPNPHDLVRPLLATEHNANSFDGTRQPKAERFPSERVTFRRRLKHFTWSWFTITMSTGGIALLLSVTPHRFRGLTTIGTIFFILDLVLFLTVSAALTTRFCMYPGTFRASFEHPSESLFFPTFWLSLPTILEGMQNYGTPSAGPWLPVALSILFWIYVACTFPVAVIQYSYLFTAKKLTVQSMTPAWILPIFPIMLSGTTAGTIAQSQPQDRRMPILVAGFTFQSLGFMVAIFMFSNYIGRMMQSGLPAPMTRGGMFISVGPPSFTGLAYISIAGDLPTAYDFLPGHSMGREILITMATFAAIFLWSLSFWFFSISLVGVLAGLRQMKFTMTWWSFVFPNVGFALATIRIGQQLQSNAVLWVGSVMTVILVVMWLLVLTCQVRAVWRNEILYPDKDEDS